ncbi:uncharacterized protein LOC129806178 [Phlebotomus papatasi]|uniref:uncharacterized protein LOC129806178 n=1 Tax=Phlebotomus papatasi TaxID=29031 RepID=UPI0024840E03|nr:uncharacterized protein LOC129806178 [Phlebotomus papatasi]
MSWKRPESVAFPQVWMTFEAKDPETGKSVQYRIQDLPEDRFQEAVHLIKTIFVRDEAMCKSLDCINDPVVERKSTDMLEEDIAQKTSLVCFKEGSDEICGLNVLRVHEKDAKEEERKISDKKTQEMFKTFAFIEKNADLYYRYEVDKYLHAFTLLVLPKYRGIGLSTEILKASIPFCRALGLKITAGIFTGTASQRSAAKAGFVEDYSVLYEDLAKYEPYVLFPNITATSVKFMSLHVPD